MSTRIRTVQTAVSALLVLSAGAAAAQTPPLPSLDGVNSISSGTLPNAASGGNGVVRTSGGSTGLPVIVTVDGTTANIQTAANRSVIDWQSFNIGEGHRVNFLLPDRASVAVNRVRGVGADFASRIDGDLWSNGNVWLLNPNGVFFGATARVDVAGLLATPAGLRNLDDLIGVDGTYDTTSTVRFNMPGSSFPTEVTTPGPVSVAAGAEILVRGGPAMFIVGSGVQGRTLTVGGTVTSRSRTRGAHAAGGVRLERGLRLAADRERSCRGDLIPGGVRGER
jgi:filamentous hemagglutinin family protein